MKTRFVLLIFGLVMWTSHFAFADFPIRQSNNWDDNPAIAYNSNDNRYLVVWNELIPSGQLYFIGPVMGQHVTEGGALIGNAFQILSNGVEPSVAYNNQTNEYFVTATWAGIKGQRVNSLGSLLGNSIQLMDNASYSRILYNSITGNYLLAGADLVENPPGSGYFDIKIFTRKIGADGQPLGSTLQVEDTHSGYQPQEARYALAYAPLQSSETPSGRYLLTTQTNIGVSLTMLNSDGAPMYIVHDPDHPGTDYRYIPFSTGTVTGGEFYVDVAYGTQSGYSMSGPTFLVVWGDNNNTWQGQESTGIWGGFVDAQKLSYLTTDPVQDNAFPISAIFKHWAYSSYAETWKPVTAFNPIAEKFMVAWRETPGPEPENDTKVNHIRANRAFVQIPPPTNVVLSATTGNEDPKNPAIAASTYSSNALVVWMDHRNSATTNWDIYGSLYTISPAVSITVTAPNGGETWVINTQQEIKWTSTNFTDPVKISVSYAGYSPQFWKTIVQSTPNDGSYMWTVPNNTAGDCVIRIEDAADGDPYDLSDATFGIIVPFTANTFPGTNVQVSLGSGVELTFDNVTGAGITYLTTSTTGPPPTSGFTIIPSGSPMYYSITTTAAFTGNINVCVQYSDAGLTTTQEAVLTLQVYESGQWQEMTTSRDENTNIICGTVTHLSDFAVMFSSATPSSIVVTSTDNSGPGSFRQALLDANASPGTDKIIFDIPGTGPHTIHPASALPTITDTVIIDGYSQPGASPNTNLISLGSNAVLKIELDGTDAGADANGLTITAGNSTVCGLVINRFGTGGYSRAAIYLNTNGGNLIEGNFLGTDVTGTLALGNLTRGVFVFTGYNIIRSNVISGNNERGIFILGSDANQNHIVLNYIGVNASGTAALGNDEGVHIQSSSDNFIGQNIISGNKSTGITILETVSGPASSNYVYGNFIGSDAAGTTAIGNGWDGVMVEAGAHGNLIEQNLISGNTYNGIQLLGAGTDSNMVRYNLVGTNVSGTFSLANGSDGVAVCDGAHNNLIEGNLVSGNAVIGIHLYGATEGNVIRNNRVGTDAGGTAELSNSFFGVALFDGARNNVVGPDNVIAFNGRSGVIVDGADSFTSTVGNTITANSITGNGGKGIFNVRGGNTELTPPTILAATPTQVSGTAGVGHIVEIFADEIDQGKVYLGSTIADGSGNFILTLSTPPPLPLVTATCTDTAGNTSEFSQAVIVVLVNVEATTDVPKDFVLSQNYPNPFNPSTKISWQSPVGSWQTLKVYDVLGNEVVILVNEEKPAGFYEVEFQSALGNKPLASGIYFYRIAIHSDQLKAGDFIQTKKMILVR